MSFARATDSASAVRQRASPRFFRWLVPWACFTLVFWLGVCGWILLSARSDAAAAEVSLRTLTELDDPASMDFEVVEATLTDGQTKLRRANERLEHPVLYPLRVLPVVGRQLASARSLGTASEDLVDVVRPLVSSARAVRADPDSVDRVQFMADAAAQLALLETTIIESDLGPSSNLVPTLAEARFELADQMQTLLADVGDYRLIADGMAAFLASEDYLLLGANNAEMRVASGMHLSIGELEVAGGEFSIADLEPSAELFPVPAAGVVDADVAERWGFLSLDNDFRKLGYSARFDEYVGPQAISMWQAETGREVDGVLLLDPFVLDALLGVVGPVDVDGRTLEAGSALEFLLQGQYAEFGTGEEETDARRDVLSTIASAVAEAFRTTSWDPIELLDALEPMAQGRHIIAYSPDPVQQLAWERLGVSGSVSANDIGVFFANTGASKLDPFQDVVVEANTVSKSESHTVTITATLTNRANAELPRYAIGPWQLLELDEPGSYSGRFGMVLPGSLQSFSLASNRPGFAELAVFGPDGASTIFATRAFAIAPGASVTFTVVVDIPVTATELELLPSARFPSSEWTWNGETFLDDVNRTIQLQSG